MGQKTYKTMKLIRECEIITTNTWLRKLKEQAEEEIVQATKDVDSFIRAEIIYMEIATEFNLRMVKLKTQASLPPVQPPASGFSRIRLIEGAKQ